MYIKHLILSLIVLATAAGGQRPNILFIAIDDLRPELGKAEMLYDLSKDPQENRNVAGDPKHAGTVATMKKLLNKRQVEAAK